jgi:beta-phosphoglucomutase
MEIKACLFDLDGVLVDTAKYHYVAWRDIARELGFEFSPAHNERLKGVSRMASLEILLEVGGVQLSNSEKEELARRKNENYVASIVKMEPDEILPGVVPFLAELQAAGIRIALGSASKNAPLILERVNLSPYFDVVIDGNSVTEAKPNPEVFTKGAQELGIKPEHCIVFEDAEAGIEAAINAQMACVGIGDPQILHKANLVIPGFQELNVARLKSALAAV